MMIDKSPQQLVEEIALLRQQIVELQTVAQDITERKRVEAEQKRLLAAEREQRLLAETLGEIFLALTSQTSREAVLAEILRQGQRLVSYSTANIALLDGNTLHIAGWQGYQDFNSEELISNLKQTLSDFPPDQQVVQTRQPLVIPDTGENPHWVVRAETTWVKSYISVPICSQERVLGLLRLDSDIPGKFSIRDIERLQPLAHAAAIALENARLYDRARQELVRRKQIEAEIVQRNAELITLQYAGATIAASLDIQFVLNAVTQEMVNLLGVEGCALFEWDQTTETVLVMAKYGLNSHWDKAVLLKIHSLTNFPIMKRVLTERRVQQMTISQAYLDPAELVYMQAGQIKTLLMLPMEFQDHIVGLVEMIDNQVERTFTTEEIALTQLLANQAASAIQNARLHAETRRRLQEQIALRGAGMAISSTLDRTIVLNRIVEQLGQAVNATSAYLCSYEPEPMTSTVLAEYFSPRVGKLERISDLGATYPLPRDFSHSFDLLLAGQPEQIHLDDSEVSEHRPGHMEQFGVKTILNIPLQIGGRIIAFAELWESQRYREFTPEEVALCQGIAQQAAIALENARLYDQAQQEITERKRAEAEQKRLLAAEHEQRLLAETLGEVFLALAAQTSHEAVLDEILQQVQRLVSYSAANIMLLEGDVLRFVRSQGYQAYGNEVWYSHLRQPLVDFPLDAKVIASRQPLVIPDTQQDSNWITVPESAWVRSFMAVPICLRDSVLGLLRLDSDTPGKFSVKDLERLQPLANAAAIALENAWLYDQARQEIADRIQAEEELRQSEARHRALLDAMPDLMFRITRDGQYLDYHSGKGWDLALPTREYIGKNVAEVLPPPAAGLMLDYIHQALDSGTIQIFEYELSLSDSIQQYETRLVVSGLNEALGIVRDIAERKRAEEALKKSEANLRAIFDNSLQAFVLIDRNHKILAFNKLASETIKLTSGEELREGISIDEAVPEAELNEFNKNFDKVCQGESIRLEKQIKFGETSKWFEFNYNPVFADNEQVIGVCFSTINIDERKKAADTLAESEARLMAEMQSVLAITRALVSEVNLNNLLEFIITQAEYLTNAEGATVLLLSEGGQELEVATPIGSWLRLKTGTRLPLLGSLAGLAITSQRVQISNYALDDDRTASIRALLQSAKIRSLLCAPLVVQSKNLGVLLVWSEHEQGFTVHNGRLMSLFADQAALAMHNAHLHTRNRQLAIERERHRLARELHDSVTQSLYSMGLAAQAALRLLGPEADSRVRNPIEHIHALSQSALTEIREQLYHLHPTVLNEDLVKALMQHCDMLRQQYPLTIEFKPTLDVSLVVSQRDALYYITREALWNIIKHAQATQVNIILTNQNDQIVISIKDNGIGFEPTAFTAGETMGLRNMAERAKLLGGTLEVHSKRGQGTQLIVRIPVAWS